MPSIRKVKNWYAQSFEVGCLCIPIIIQLVGPSLTQHPLQELISFPPLSLSPAARKSLYSCLDKEERKTHLLESVPNPSLSTSYLDGHGAVSGTGYGEDLWEPYGDCNGNSVAGLRNGSVKLRVPSEQRLVGLPVCRSCSSYPSYLQLLCTNIFSCISARGP